MAEKRGIIDVEAMYKAGFSSKSTGKNPANEARKELINSAYSVMGDIAIGAMKNGFINLQKFRNKTDSQTALLNLRVDKMPRGNEDLKASIKEIKKRYDKAARNASLGIGKMRSKGRQDMALYMQQLTDMNAELEIYKTNAEASQGMVSVLLGVAGENNQAGNVNMNPSATRIERNNTLEQANGLMGLNLRWDVDNPGLMVQRGGVWSTDENDKDIYINKVSTGTYEEYAKDYEGMKDKDDKTVEPMSRKEWEEANQQNEGLIRLAKYSNMRFASKEDNIMENDLKALRVKLIDGAWSSDAKPWHIISGAEKDNFMGKIDSYSDLQFKDFYFGGLSYDYSTNRMDKSAPAYMRLKGQDIINGNVNIDDSFKEGYGPGTKDWESRLMILQEQSFVKGSTFRKAVAEDLWAVMETQYKDTNDEYKRENPENDKGGTTWNTSFGAVDKSRANEFVNNLNSGKVNVRDLQGNDWTMVDGKYTIKGTDGIVSRTPAEMMERQDMASYYPKIYKTLYSARTESEEDYNPYKIVEGGGWYGAVGDKTFGSITPAIKYFEKLLKENNPIISEAEVRKQVKAERLKMEAATQE